MSTNRASTLRLNRRHITDDEARQQQRNLDSFLREPFADPATAPLVFGPVRVTNNIFTSLFRVFRVMPGTAVVVVGNGQVLEVLTEGSYHALSFPVMNRIDLYVVNVRERTLDIETQKAFNLFYQTPDGEIAVPVDLNVAVTYQITAPDRVALYVDQPLTMLFDTVLESMRAIIAYTKYRDFQAGGHAGYMIAQQLQQRGVEDSLGIRVSNVQITRLAGAEELDRTLRDVFLETRKAQTQAEVKKIEAQTQADIAMAQAVAQMNIARMIEITPEYLLTANPEMYTRIFGDRVQSDALRLTALTELAKAGMLPMGAGAQGGDDFRNTLLQALTGSTPTTAPAQPLGAPAGSALPAPARFSAATARERLIDEVHALTGQGMNAALREDMGAYYVTVKLRDAAGHTLDIYFACTGNYPQEAPTMFLELDGQPQSFAPVGLSNWTPQSDLLALVDAVTAAYA